MPEPLFSEVDELRSQVQLPTYQRAHVLFCRMDDKHSPLISDLVELEIPTENLSV